MVGPGLRKNPVYDILHDQPLRIHPDSQYQFLHTDEVARIAWQLVRSGASGTIYNLAGQGLVSPRDIAQMAGKKLDVTLADPKAQPRVVNASIDKISKVIAPSPTKASVQRFLQEHKTAT